MFREHSEITKWEHYQNNITYLCQPGHYSVFAAATEQMWIRHDKFIIYCFGRQKSFKTP